MPSLPFDDTSTKSAVDAVEFAADRPAASIIPSRIPVESCRQVIAAAERFKAMPNATADEAVMLAECLVGCFRSIDGYASNEAFAASLTMLFGAYPADVGRHVCHPVYGLPGRLKFPPSIAEVREALDGIVGPIKAAGYNARRLLRMAEDAARAAAEVEPSEAQRERVRQMAADALANMKARCSERPEAPEVVSELAEKLRRLITGETTRHGVERRAKQVWQELGEGHIGEDDAQRLAEYVNRTLRAMRWREEVE